MVRPKEQGPLVSRTGEKVRQNLPSSGSDSSSNEFRWSEVDSGPNLKSTKSVGSADSVEHFTQF